MHIQLSLEAGNKTRYFLSVKDNVIKLRLMEETTELERSFLWLPTKSLKGQASRSKVGFNNQRSRKFDIDTLFGTNISEKLLKDKDEEIQMLLAEVKRLKEELFERQSSRN